MLGVHDAVVAKSHQVLQAAGRRSQEAEGKLSILVLSTIFLLLAFLLIVAVNLNKITYEWKC